MASNKEKQIISRDEWIYLSHVSRILKNNGHSKQWVLNQWGEPLEKRRSDFIKPKIPNFIMPDEASEQWIYMDKNKILKRLVLFSTSNTTVFLCEEWSDW